MIRIHSFRKKGSRLGFFNEAKTWPEAIEKAKLSLLAGNRVVLRPIGTLDLVAYLDGYTTAQKLQGLNTRN